MHKQLVKVFSQAIYPMCTTSQLDQPEESSHVHAPASTELEQEVWRICYRLGAL